MLLFAEEAALKRALSGIKVFDPKAPNGRNVQVFFRYPDDEFRPTYPFITIDLFNITEAKDRMHSVYWVDSTYWPSETPDVWAAQDDALDDEIESIRNMRFMPIDLWFQISTYAREVQHDRQLHIKLLGTNRIPFRWGHLDIPEDNTIRNMDTVSWQQADYVGGEDENQQKRTFRKVYTVKVSAQMAPFDLQRLLKVRDVSFTINANDGQIIEELVTP